MHIGLRRVPEHRCERARVIVRTEERHLAADQLRVLTGPAAVAQQSHLRVHLLDGCAPSTRTRLASREW